MNERESQRIRDLLAERKSRENEALRLFRPLKGGQEAFLKSNAIKRVVRGGNRSGKSSTASAEFASAATGIPLHDSEGNELPFKYPTNRPLVMWIIGYDLDHLSRNIYRLLFKPGMFKTIKDLETGRYRTFRPWDESDKARVDEVVLSEPLIPKRFVEGFAWENKAQRVFKVCRLKNGTEIRAFSSMGEPPQGDQCDLIWVDEDLENEEYIMEASMRIIDRGGRFFWSAFPKSKNMALRKLSEEAESANPLAPSCTEHVIRMSDNPYLDQAVMQSILSGLTDEERRARDFGEFCDDLIAMFPTFDERTHGIKTNPDEQDEIDQAVLDNGFSPPDDWTRYLILDPGHARPFVLFAAVPPPYFDPKRQPTVLLYDEIAKPRIDAAETARLVHEKVGNQLFEAFIIDDHAGRQTSMGRGETIKQLYSAEFDKHGLRSRLTGNSFVNGSDNVMAGLGAIREGLHIQGDGRSRFRFLTDGEKRNRVPNLCKQVLFYKKMLASGVVEDKPAPHQVDDGVHCLRYLAAFNPYYQRPQMSEKQYSPAYRMFLKSKKTAQRNKRTSMVCGPQFSPQ